MLVVSHICLSFMRVSVMLGCKDGAATRDNPFICGLLHRSHTPACKESEPLVLIVALALVRSELPESWLPQLETGKKNSGLFYLIRDMRGAKEMLDREVLWSNLK